MSNSLNFDYMLKYIIIGDSGVGKSNILLKYIYGKFNEEFQSTIGVEFGAKNIEIKNKIFRTQIWDTAGQEMFRSITRAYFKNSVCACVVYDITNRKSFESIKSWIEDCKKHSPKTVYLILIGNKIDLENSRQIPYDEGESYAKKYGMLFYETSAKTGKNINELFIQSCEDIYKRIERGYYDLNRDTCGIKLGIDQKGEIILENKTETENESGYCCSEN